jgi:hypothetical protein
LPNDNDICRLQIAVKNAAFVRRVQCVGDLARQPDRFVSSHGTAERFPLEILIAAPHELRPQACSHLLVEVWRLS